MKRKNFFAFKIINQNAGIIIQIDTRYSTSPEIFNFMKKMKSRHLNYIKEAAKNGWKLLLIWNFWNRY